MSVWLVSDLYLWNFLVILVVILLITNSTAIAVIESEKQTWLDCVGNCLNINRNSTTWHPLSPRYDPLYYFLTLIESNVIGSRLPKMITYLFTRSSTS